MVFHTSDIILQKMIHYDHSQFDTIYEPDYNSENIEVHESGTNDGVHHHGNIYDAEHHHGNNINAENKHHGIIDRIGFGDEGLNPWGYEPTIEHHHYEYPGGQIFVNEIDKSHCKIDVLNNGSNLEHCDLDFDHGPKHIDLEHGGSLETYRDSDGDRHVKVHTDNSYLGDNTSNDYDINIDKNKGGCFINTNHPPIYCSSQPGFNLVF